MLRKIEAGDLSEATFRALTRAERVAWDTETTGLDFEQDTLQLCQLYAPDFGAVVVRISEELPTRLATLLMDSSVEKVFHHAPFDLRFMSRAWGITAQRVTCTKVASKILNPLAPNSKHSLKELLEDRLSLALDKGSVRTSDWGRKELTAAQFDYAVNDVAYLLKLLDSLESDLADNGLLDLFRECCAFIPTRVRLEMADFPDVFAY